MDVQTREPAEEIKRLQRCLNDLISVLALPAMWSGGEPFQIIHTLLDALLRMLQLDLVYIRLKETGGHAPIEMVRFARSQPYIAQPQEIGVVLKQWLGADPQQWPPLTRNHLGDREISIVPLGLGVQGEIGIIVAGSERANFPQQTERLILSVAANQASMGLQEAWLRNEQKRVASELDRRVAQRTTELAAANQELRKEIADRRHAEEDLRSSEERHRVIVEAAHDAVVSMDERGVILLANASTRRIFGYDPVEIVGKPMTVLMPEMMRKLHENGFRRYLATGKRHLDWQGVEVTAQRKDGQEFPVEVSFGELTSDGHKVFTGFIRDISERKQAEDQLRASERNLQMTQAELARVSRLTTMGELTASIAHEVNQPLTAVINNASACLRLLANNTLEPVVLRRALEGIIADGTRASSVLARIRAFIKKEPAEKSELDINEVIQEVLALAGHELYENQVLPDQRLKTDLPAVLADRVQLQQVLLNLIMNGIEAMAAVTDRARLLGVHSRIDESGDVLVAVSDSGIGFGLELDRVFNPFFTTKANGMGMGLSISRSLVESHGGRLWAAPNSPHGAVFCFTLPSNRREFPMTGAPIVFVVDDDPSVRSSLKFLLSTVGLHVESFDSADAFLHKKPSDAPSCLVLDVRLPGLSGLDFQRELAARNARIPIIFLTGHGDIPMSVRAMKAGAVEFLTKPFRDQDLLDAVRIALERDRARREQDKDVTILQQRFDSLTSREQEVISMVVSGMLNKQIADQLGTAESTVKVQRSRAIEKMHAESLVDLIRMIEKLKGRSG
jgi:RNA polymerase sigma factor (sigma-70 family)